MPYNLRVMTTDLRGLCSRISLLLLLGAVLGAVPADATRAPYETGEKVRVTGVVTDAAGEPLEDLEIVLEASRFGFHVGPFGKSPREVARGSTRTNERGEFSLQWNWNPRFQRYELIVTVPTRGPSGPELHTLSRTDITRRVVQGSPVAITVVIEDTEFLETQRSFLAALDSPDEKRVYERMGKPDRVDRLELPGRVERSWWYFTAGRVYRFADGRLTGSESFDPVRPQ